MVDSTGTNAALRDWSALTKRIEKATAGLSDADLDLRGGKEGLSIREIVLHLVESNLIAATIVIAALARSGCTVDWSWVQPGGPWMKNIGYDRAPIDPALQALEALCLHIAGLIRLAPDAFSRHVQLQDAPGAAPYTRNVEELLNQELEHADHHLQALPGIRAAAGH